MGENNCSSSSALPLYLCTCLYTSVLAVCEVKNTCPVGTPGMFCFSIVCTIVMFRGVYNIIALHS